MSEPLETFWVERGEDGLYLLPDGSKSVCGKLPPGATYDAYWMKEHFPDEVGPDGRTVMVVCPDGWRWNVDSQASNCDKKDDKVHKCWVRHGDPTKAELTVDKNGNTCGAGAGSILTPNWHGFLREGVLITA